MIRLRAATSEDFELVLELMREFTATQVYPFRESTTGRVLRELLTSADLGRVWLIEVDGFAAGYIVLTLGFSFEHGGRDGFIDELFVRSPYRGKGLGRAAISLMLGEASRLGVQAVHLEVERSNESAHRLYRSLGFQSNDRHLLTRRLHGRDEVEMARHVPAGWPTVVPRIAVDDPEALVIFVQHVFGAMGELHRDRPSELRIGDSIIMIGSTVEREAMPAFLYVYVEDADEVFRRAVDRGAKTLEEPQDMPYGDRRAMIRDPWGNTWQIATHGGRFAP